MVPKGVTFKIPDRYRYIGPKLVGGQGYVYKYIDLFLDREVAIKEMKYLGDADDLRNELTRISEIRSRHVVEVFDFFEAKHSNGIAIVEEYIDGKTLYKLIEEPESPAIQNIIIILWQIACGISDIHDQGIIHRDIKPQNMKLDGDGIIKILDFGLSAHDEPDAETIGARGTPYYRSPEMYSTPPIPLTRALDVYAFGVTAWYLLNKGILPKTLRDFPPLSKTPCQSFQKAKIVLPERLTDIFDQTMISDPEKRPSMITIRDILRSQLLSGKHRLVFSNRGETIEISIKNPMANLKSGSSSLDINYNNFEFVISNVSGDIYINNRHVVDGITIPISCVLTFGDPTKGAGRTHVPMTVVVPEVVL